VVRPAVPAAAYIAVPPFELELIARVQPRPELARLERATAPERAAAVSHRVPMKGRFMRRAVLATARGPALHLTSAPHLPVVAHPRSSLRRFLAAGSRRGAAQ